MRREKQEEVEKGLGENTAVLLRLRKEYGQAVQDVGFRLGNLSFEFENGTGQDFSRGRDGGGSEELRVLEGKKPE